MFELEQSGCARSYLAIDHGGLTHGVAGEQGERLVVVHVVPPSLTRAPEFIPRFVIRASALLSMTHPNLVRTLDFVADGQRCHWISEFIQGHTLASLLAKKKGNERALALRQHLTILCEVLRGLEYAHRSVDAAGVPSPVAYRHLSPSSVLVSYEGRVKITDALLCAAPKVIFGRFDGEAERLAYQAPECCRDGAGDPRSDIFAVGALLWEAVCGRPRPVGASLDEAIDMCLRAAEPPFDSVAPHVSLTLIAITRRALAKDPRERYQSARELRLGLEAQMPPVPASRDRGSRFAFMCNHFYDEHDALQRLLEWRAPGVLAAARDAEINAGSAALSSLAISAPPPLLGSPSGLGVLRPVRRLRQVAAVLSIAGAVVLGYLLIRPKVESPRGPETALQSLRSPPVPPQPAVQAGSTKAAPATFASEGAAPALPDTVANAPATPASATAAVPAAPAGAIHAPALAPLPARAGVIEPRAGAQPSAPSSGVLSSGVLSSGVLSSGVLSSSALELTRAGLPPEVRSRPALDHEQDHYLAPRVTPEPDEGAGVDLRSIGRRAPRPIDKADPYTQ